MKEILIVVDMQVDFIDGSLGTKEAVEILPAVAEKIENFKGDVIFTKDTHFEDYLNTQEGKNLPVLHCIKGTNGHEIHQTLQKYVTNYIQEKNTFGSKDLPDLIEKINVKKEIMEITIIGLCTDICVISNALVLKAYFPQTKIIVDASCCAGVNKQSHENALNAMKMCQIEIENQK